VNANSTCWQRLHVWSSSRRDLRIVEAVCADGSGATNKETGVNPAELLDTMLTERARWEALLLEVGTTHMNEPGVEGQWSIRDVIAHITAYERWAAASVSTALRVATATQRELYGPATSGEIAALERDDYNAWVVAQNRDRPLDDVLADGQEAFRRLLKVVHVLTDEQITDAHRFAFTGGRPLWQWLPDQSYQHYRMHIPAIRRWLDRRER
jgi:hypothetical protein